MTLLRALQERLRTLLRPLLKLRQRQSEPHHTSPKHQSTPKKAVQTAVVATTAPTLQVSLQNQTTSSQVYAYITGQALDNNNALFILQSDGRTPYYPTSPSTTGQKLAQNVSIPLGAPGNSITVTIPRIAGGRIWFSQDAQLQFFLNPGPGLVEPSIFNQSDPNINTNFAFCEFTYNSAEMFINISYVDFVPALPVALTLTDTSGNSQHVSGLPSNGLDTICNGLTAQTAKDNRRWSSLIVQNGGKNLRALSPNSGLLLHPTWFQTYWQGYVDSVWSTYTSKPLTVNTQSSYGDVNGQVDSSGNLNFSKGAATFAKPSAQDIFGCSTGPFATGSNTLANIIIPRLAAAFNRSTLLLSNNVPNGVQASQYYQDPTTNHYSRIVHAANLDRTGYAFPYDDVVPNGGAGQEGALSSGSPASLIVAVGGGNAYAA
ncbi:hypothetical protein AMS68_006987 [Peltaster fructicola]|uniref:GH64 domain-containing protein n=1 Tax=Peltaster fructicola TaxID=286661 RepID=A0A6H0Y4D6_9PEZI|nr:hypothetical protein AMS68_006987 [Peltaster fructicola]